jgi:hypothetical protein
LVDALRTGEAVNVIRESVRVVLQELIEVEATDLIGAARYERSDTRSNERNGSVPPPRVLAMLALSAHPVPPHLSDPYELDA